MKKPKIIRLRFLAALWPSNKRRRGVAIITVLAIVSLMTVLIISFFQMAQTAKTTAIGSVEMERVQTLKDVITNYVTAQIRTATTLPGSSPSSPTIWTSQPGAIRTFHGSNQSLNRLYKLYSSEKMLIDNIPIEQSGALLNEIEGDIDAQWDQYPDMYVDLNKPVRPSSSERDSSSSAATIKTRLIYPIVDPGRYNGQESDIMRNTEGFVYGEKTLSARTINGVDNNKGQLSMPVRWIYMLRNGTPGTVNKEGKFTAMQKEGGEPSKENPIVSRIGWWVDDESCKINVNTASLPIPWDNPHTASYEDLWYAQHQPVSGECQHYPGHPATTDLCAVFFPGQRYSPDANAMPVGTKMRVLSDNYAKAIWNITPYITENGGSNGGKDIVKPLSVAPVPLDNDDHLFATYEELYFKARKADKNLDRPRESVGRDDVSGELLDRIATSQFFLTTRSNGPEMTVFGTPRVCMFPMNEAVVNEVKKNSGAINPVVGTFEVTMATNATIGAATGANGKPFYFQRSTNSTSRHHAFYTNNVGRNAQIFKYLKKLTIAIPPGYPELSKTDFKSFGQKYPGPNRTEGNIAIPSKVTANFDSSDRTQIIISMLDLLRSSNMSPGYLESGKSYDNGGGQVSGICGCNKINPGDVQRGHTDALKIVPSQPTVYTPKGSGRTFGAAEIIFCANVVAVKSEGRGTEGNANIMPRNPAALDRWNKAKKASLIQVAVMVNNFSPRQGWAPLFGHSGVNLSNEIANTTNQSDPRSVTDGTQPAPIVVAEGNPETALFFGIASNGENMPPNLSADPPVTLPLGYVPWAGMAGVRVGVNRAWDNNGADAAATVATFDPYVYEGDGAGSKGPVTLTLKWTPGKILRVFMYDEGGAASVVDATNTIQAIELDLGAETFKVHADYTGEHIDKAMDAVKLLPTTDFPPPTIAMTSFVVPHGDYRLTTTPLEVERGIFVPHGTGKHSVVEPMLRGQNAGFALCNGAVMAPTNEQLLTDMDKIPAMLDSYAPHFAPVSPGWLCREDLGTKPVDSVITVASSRANPNFKLRFAHGRRDGQYRGPQYKPFAQANTIPNRGSSDPLETGDFDTGVGLCPDGAYMNQPDDGDARDPNMPYYMGLGKLPKVSPATFSPNRVLRSAVDFGSLPSGLQARVPWQTLRFRPDPKMYDGKNLIKSLNDLPKIPDSHTHYFPFSNYCGPKDHLLLDMWWMPVVEPWAISEGFATKGLINLNQQIFPFTYIQRTTALHALLRSERMMAVPDGASQHYKNGSEFPGSDVYRHWINAKETIKQLTEFRWRGQDCEGFTLPFNTFRSASEICELWLVPEKNGRGDEQGDWDLASMWDNSKSGGSFWEKHRLTGDNMRERPYSNIYPRLTVRSNVYRVHMIAQTLKQASTNKPENFRSSSENGDDTDAITAEWRGSALIERVLNPNEPELQKFDYAPPDSEDVYDSMNIQWKNPKLDNFYTYRVTEVKQFTE